MYIWNIDTLRNSGFFVIFSDVNYLFTITPTSPFLDHMRAE